VAAHAGKQKAVSADPAGQKDKKNTKPAKWVDAKCSSDVKVPCQVRRLGPFHRREKNETRVNKEKTDSCNS
jgi:hypothetical protein